VLNRFLLGGTHPLKAADVARRQALGQRAFGVVAADRGSGRKTDVRRQEAAARLRARGLTLEEVGRELGVSKQAVHRLLGGQRRPHRRTAVPCAGCSSAAVGDEEQHLRLGPCGTTSTASPNSYSSQLRVAPAAGSAEPWSGAGIRPAAVSGLLPPG
jgi:hypothetical protein